MRGLWRWYRARGARLQWSLGILALVLVLGVLGSLSPSKERESADRDAHAGVAVAAPARPASPRPKPARPSPTPTPSPTRRPSSRDPLAALAALSVKGR